MELPIEGSVSINGHGIGIRAQPGIMPGIPSWVKMGKPLRLDASEEKWSSAQPVILQGKPDFDDTLSVMERVV